MDATLGRRGAKVRATISVMGAFQAGRDGGGGSEDNDEPEPPWKDGPAGGGHLVFRIERVIGFCLLEFLDRQEPGDDGNSGGSSSTTSRPWSDLKNLTLKVTTKPKGHHEV